MVASALEECEYKIRFTSKGRNLWMPTLSNIGGGLHANVSLLHVDHVQEALRVCVCVYECHDDTPTETRKMTTYK